jgi:transcription antitermination factor NusA-like protein
MTLKSRNISNPASKDRQSLEYLSQEKEIPNHGCKQNHRVHMIITEVRKEARTFHHCLLFRRIIHDTSKAMNDRRIIKTRRINNGTFADQSKL